MSFERSLRQLLVAAFGFLAPRSRREEFQGPLPESMREQLKHRSRHYRRLPLEVREEFDRQMQVFMTEKPVTPVKASVTGEIRLLTAASAVTLSAGWSGYTWDQLAEVLVYPKNFDEDHRFVEANDQRAGTRGPYASGQTHPWGVVILVKPELIRSFAVDATGHVGYHEFAHLLDLQRSTFDGAPAHPTADEAKEWSEILVRETERLQRGDSILDPYGLSNPTELFAVAVESFFQRPVELAEGHRQLYRFLASYFNQQPAAWAIRASS